MTDKYLCDTCGCDENHYDAIQRVRELHKEEKRYYVHDAGESSWDSIEDVIAYYGDDQVTPEEVASFSICAECGRLESNLAKIGDYDYSYESSQYPCPTIEVLDGESK